MITEIYIEGNLLDISADLSSLLTFAIDDVKDFASRQTTFSKTVILPGTARNNALLGNIFETGHSNDYDPALSNVGYNFNASKSAKCLIFQDQLQTFKGALRLIEIIKDKQGIEYEVALNGELTSLSVSLSTGLLQDLDFSAYDHQYSIASITGSWDNPGGSGYYYPLIDYGNYSPLKHDWDIRTLRPALYAKEYLDKMFAAANFTYDCALFNTPRFKSLIIPHNQKILTNVSTQILSATRSGTYSILNSGTFSNQKVEFTGIIGTTFTASLSNSRFTYSGATPQTFNVNASVFGTSIANLAGYTIEIRLNGVLIPGQRYTIAPRGNTTSQFYSWSTTVPVSFVTGYYIELVASYSTAPFVPEELKINTVGLGVNSVTATTVSANPGDFIQVNRAIPQNIRQVDFLLWIVKLFNLYIYESQFDERLIHISPFVDFYSTDSSNADDWTYKMNRDKPVKIKPMSELNSKIYKFQYKDDNDFYNDQYKKRYNQGYGSYIYDTQFEFASQTTTVEIGFAATPLVGYGGEDKVYSTMFKKSGDIEENIDSVIRILQTKKVTGVTAWDIKDGDDALATLTNYGYAGHLDDPDSPDNDLNFGALKELYFVLISGDLTKTQFNLYWSTYMAEITDKDSKLLSAYFYLTPRDIFNLSFSKYKYVDGVLFRLNAVRDYNTTIPSDCQCEMIKVIQTLY